MLFEGAEMLQLPEGMYMCSDLITPTGGINAHQGWTDLQPAVAVLLQGM